MFGKKLQIGEGDKYDLSKVSTETVNQEEVAKKNAKLIEIFKSFDRNNDGKLSSAEMALALEAFDSLDISGDDKISKKEFQEAAENFNKNMKLEGKDQVDAKDLKTFIKNLFKATKNDPTAETQKVIEQYNKEQEQIALQQKQDAVEADAKRRGWEWSLDGAYWDKKNNKYYLPNADMTAFEEVHWSDSEQKFKVMSADELAELEAAKVAEAEAAKNKQTPQLHKYIVQTDDKFTEVISKALQAQGIEKPTKEQIEKAKEQFKKDNPNAVRSTEDGYEFLLVGAEVNLRGEVASAKSSKEAIAEWSEKYPDKVWKPKSKGKEEVKGKGDPQGLSLEERAENVKDATELIAPDLTPKETLDNNLQEEAEKISANTSNVNELKSQLDEVLSYDLVGAAMVRNYFTENTNKDNIAYLVDDKIAEKMDNVLGIGKGYVYNFVLSKLKARAEELGIDEKYKDFNTISDDLSLQDMQKWITTLSNDIKAADKKVVDSADADKEAYENEQAALKKLNDNKKLFEKSNNSLVRAADLAQNEPDSVKIEKHDSYETCELADGTKIYIERDEDGNIKRIEIRNSGGPDDSYDVKYIQGTVAFDPDEKDNGSNKYKETIKTNAFNFEKIKELAEMIFGKAPKTEE